MSHVALAEKDISSDHKQEKERPQWFCINPLSSLDVGRVFVRVEHDVSGVLGVEAIPVAKKNGIGKNSCSFWIERSVW